MSAMQKLLHQKWFVLLLALAGLLALAVIASGLTAMRFDPAGQLPFAMPQGDIDVSSTPQPEAPFWQTLLFWMIISVVLALGLALFDPESRKKLLQQLIRFGLIGLGIYLFFQITFNSGGISFGGQGSQGQGAVPGLGEMPVFSMPVIPQWLRFGVATLLVFGSVWFFMWAIRQRREPKKTEMKLEDLADISREALSQLKEGRHWGDAITDCYLKMSQAVSTERGIERQESMTPQEFGMRMQQAGMPVGAVQTLTSLFEEVRYGGKQINQQKINQATASLQAILLACEAGR